MDKNRKSGIIMHISSIQSKYGIGTFGKKAYEFCDFLKNSGFHYWQILPIGPTSYGDSPYQSFSSFAGNPYFIDLDILKDEGLLKEEDYNQIDFGSNKTRVDYGKLYNNRFKVLKLAYSNFKDREKLDEFIENNKDWLEEYALFMALKEEFNGSSWENFEEGIKNREEKSMKYYKEKLKEEIDFHYFVQYEFFKQFKKFKKYVNSKGIEIIGDIPIYCAYDSVDVWQNKEQFNLELVGGCPPDGFSLDGQLWGNPTYNYEYMEKNGYSWWVNRIKKTFELFDVIRIDHFRGFESYWAVNKNEKTARNGKWLKGPANKLFSKVKEQLGDIDIIAEDLGYTTKEVIDFRNETGFPGMKIMQEAYDLNHESEFLPHNIERNFIAYASTHDSSTIKGWVNDNYNKKEFEFAKKYLNLTKEEGYVWGLLRATWSSVANTAITQIQDFLELDNNYRMNVPATLGNWSYRIDDELLTKSLEQRLYDFNKLYFRLNK